MLNIIVKYFLINIVINIYCVEDELLVFFGFIGEDIYCNERCDGFCFWKYSGYWIVIEREEEKKIISFWCKVWKDIIF